MNRINVLNDIRDTFGLVPGFFETLPDEVLEEEWGLFKKEISSNTIPSKYQHLIGLAVASAIRCQYCTLFHTKMARVLGATDDEINAAIRQAKQVAGWSTYLHGIRYDINKLEKELDKMIELMRNQKEERESEEREMLEDLEPVGVV